MFYDRNQSVGRNIEKNYVANTATNCIMRVISFVILAIIWGGAGYILWKMNWLEATSKNLRTGIFIAVIALPIIICGIIDYKLRRYFFKKA